MILSSQVVGSATQKDGRIQVSELHLTDEVVAELRFFYTALANTDTAAILNSRAAAYNAALAAIPSVTVTMDDGTVATVRTYDFGNMDLRLTAGQKTALQTAKLVIDAVRPLLRIYYNLTPTQQAFVLAHTPWFVGVLAVVNG